MRGGTLITQREVHKTLYISTTGQSSRRLENRHKLIEEFPLIFLVPWRLMAPGFVTSLSQLISPEVSLSIPCKCFTHLPVSAHQILALVANMRCHDLLCIGRLVSKAEKVKNTMHILFVGNTYFWSIWAYRFGRVNMWRRHWTICDPVMCYFWLRVYLLALMALLLSLLTELLS